MNRVSPDTHFMELALEQAALAQAANEVPVGAVIVYRGTVIAAGHNHRERSQDASAHAEIIAIREACAALGSWRLEECTLYVTLEPCPMCAGAAVNARIERIVYGAPDPKAGACGSVTDLFALPLNHRPAVTAGVLAGSCGGILTEFFSRLRKRS